MNVCSSNVTGIMFRYRYHSDTSTCWPRGDVYVIVDTLANRLSECPIVSSTVMSNT